MIRLVRVAILNLAGVPSIVFGLFGFGLFVIFFGWNVSLLAGWFTLGLMVLPAIITASEESLRAVPQGLREGSLALGATKWQTIRKNVLPYALPGILTSSILGIARVAGETAPIMFTAAYAMSDEMPWQVARWTDFFFQGVMALPYHIYVVSSKIPQNEYTERVQYGGAFVFLVPRDADCADLDCLARTKQEPSIMVSVARNAGNQPHRSSSTSQRRSARTRQSRARHDRDRASRFQLRRRTRSLHDVNLNIPATRGHRVHRAVRLRQDDAAALPQPDERSHRRRAHHARLDPDRRRRYQRARRRRGRSPAARRHGFSEIESVSEIDLRQRRLRLAHCRGHEAIAASTRRWRKACAPPRSGTK